MTAWHGSLRIAQVLQQFGEKLASPPWPPKKLQSLTCTQSSDTESVLPRRVARYKVVDRDACQRTLDAMARSTHYHTQANISRFYTNPAEYNNSEEFFRMLMLVTVLQQDFGVRYNPRRIEEFDFQEPSDLFMHGLLGYGEGGTCVSIPTIYADVAQRLGYPVSLVYAKQHLFCRWDGPNARFNIEGTNHGMNSCPDEHYLTWPKPIAEVEVAAGQYLKTMSKRECLAAFLAIRAHCLEDNGMVVGASRAYDWAISLAPRQEQYRQFRNQLVNSTAMVFLPAPGASDRSVILRSGSPYIVPGGSQVITAADIMRLSLQKHPY